MTTPAYPTVFLFLVVLSFCAAQQKCELWQGQPALCGELYTANETYIWAGTSQQALVLLMANSAKSLTAVKSLSRACYLRAVWLLCASYLPPCSPSGLADPPYFESLSCRSSCEETNFYCKGITPFQNCSQLNPLRGTPAFPESTFPARYNNITYNLNCSVAPASLLTKNYTVSCGGPLYRSDLNDGTCTLKCPTTFYTPKEWKMLTVTIHVVGWVGFILLVLVLFPYVIIKKRRSPPLLSHTCLVIGIMPLSIACLMGSLAPHNVICTSKTKRASFHYAPCVIQAICMIWSAIATNAWCMWVLFDIWLTFLTVSGKVPQLPFFKYLFPIQAVIGFGVPAICIIIGLASKSLTYVSNSALCSITNSPHSVFKGYDSFIFWMPFDIFWAIGISLWVTFFFAILMRTGLNPRSVFFALKSQIRCLLFVGYFFIAIGLLNAYRFITKPKRDTILASYTAWLQCWAAKGAGAAVTCSSAPHPRNNYKFDFISQILCLGAPIVFFFILGSVADVRDFYRKLFDMIRKCNFNSDAWSELSEVNISSSAPASVNKSSASESEQQSASAY